MIQLAQKNQYEELTEQQRKFADHYFEFNNGTKAAIHAGYGEAGAHTQASRLLKNVKVRDYITNLEKERRERIMNLMASMAEDSIKGIYELAKSADSESVRLQAYKDVLDRSGYKPTEKVEQKSENDTKITFGFVDPMAETE